MEISPIYSYYNNSPVFKARMRVNQKTRPLPFTQKNSPNVQVYVYEDLNSGIDINERTYDSFTGLRDKQYLLAVLNKKMEECQKTGNSLSFAMFDMDNFKSVNELLGYETGDDFIRFIADSVEATAKKNALSAYRFGGEEFVVVFENQDDESKKSIVNSIVSAINSNKYIKSQEGTYVENAQDRVVSYSMQIAKVKGLMDLKAKKEIYDDLEKHLQTEEAKNDPYLLGSIQHVNDEIKKEYIALLQYAISSEADSEVRTFATRMLDKIESHQEISKSEIAMIDEYLRYKFDKSAELFQVKKWLRDFKNNNGFSITGSAVSFNPKFMKNRTPMQLIGIAGEALKRGKEAGKGRGYFEGHQQLS